MMNAYRANPQNSTHTHTHTTKALLRFFILCGLVISLNCAFCLGVEKRKAEGTGMENREIWFDDSLDYFNNQLCDEDKKCCKVEQSQPIVVCETTDIVTTVKFKHIYRKGEIQQIDANKDAEYQEQAISYAKDIIDNTVSGIQKDNLDCEINNNDVLCHIDNDKKFKIRYNSIASYKTYDEYACKKGEQSSCKQLRQKEAAAPVEAISEEENPAPAESAPEAQPAAEKVEARAEVEQETANAGPEGEIKEEDKREEIEEEPAKAPIEEEKTAKESVDFPKEVHCDDRVTESYLKNNGALLCISKNDYHVNDEDWKCANPSYSNHSVLCQNKKTNKYTKVVFLEIVSDDADKQKKALENDVDAIMDAFNKAIKRLTNK